MRIDFKGYDQPVKALVPYKDEPVKFYKWWCENQDEIKITFTEKIELFDKVFMQKPNVLKAEHRKIINK